MTPPCHVLSRLQRKLVRALVRDSIVLVNDNGDRYNISSSGSGFHVPPFHGFYGKENLRIGF